MTATADFLDRYRNVFEHQHKQDTAEAPWLRHAREHAFNELLNQGLPTRQWENWRYTPVVQWLDDVPLTPAVNDPPDDPIATLGVDIEPKAAVLVFVDGLFRPHCSRLTPLTDQVTLHALSHLQQPPDTDLTAPTPQPFALLNTSLFRDGVLIDIHPGAVIDAPIYCLHTAAADTAAAAFPRVFVHSRPNSHATVIDCFIDPAGTSGRFTNACTQLHLDRDSRLDYLRLVRASEDHLHIGGIYVQQEAGSQLDAFTFVNGGRLVRSDWYTRLGAPGTRTGINGVTLATGRQHVDTQIDIDHQVENCLSDCLFKSITTDKAHTVFNGKARIEPRAQRSETRIYHRNLLLTAGAEVDTKPELEIYADDVKAAHGATVSRLDERQIFYLRARGLDRPAAIRLLNHAFINEMILNLANPVMRRVLQQWADDFFGLSAETDIWNKQPS